MSEARGWILALCLLLPWGPATAQGWPSQASAEVDVVLLAAAVDASHAVRQAALNVEDARLALASAGALVSGSLRSSAELGWSDSGGLEAGLGAITLSTQWSLFPAGPSHQAYLRALDSLASAEEALARVRRETAIEALGSLWALQRLTAEAAVAEARAELAWRREAAVRSQHEAGAVHASTLEEAGLAGLQADLALHELLVEITAAELAFERAIGVPPVGLLPAGTIDLASWPEVAATAVAGLPAFTAPLQEEQEAAILASSSVRNATASLDQAVKAGEDARRAAGPSASLSAGFAAAGENGRLSLGTAWDSGSMQPSLNLSVDPWSAQQAQTSAQLGLTVTIPLDSGRAADLARNDLAVLSAEAALAQASRSAALDLETRQRSLSGARASLELATARLGLRETSLASLRTRADFGSVSPLELMAAELDVAEAALALLSTLDQVVLSQAQLELALLRPPSHPTITAAMAALTSPSPEAP